jgi:histone deacetylase 1/2
VVEEYSSIMRNDMSEIVPRPEDKSLVGSRWVYKIKQGVDESVEKCKAKFVAKGF